MRKLILVLLFLLLGLVFLVPTPARAVCNEGEWSFEMETKGESWLGDYGACSGGRYRCHSVCWDRWSTQCVGGVWVRKWVASSGCSKDHVCRAQTGWSGRHCDCCTPPTHKECNTATKKCVSVPGVGPDKCQNDSECAPPPTAKHKECRGSECKPVDGAGPDKCATDAECQVAPSCECTWQEKDCGGGGACAATKKLWVRHCVPKIPNATCDSDTFECRPDPDCSVPTQQVAAWFQTARGDVVDLGEIKDNIPSPSEVLPFSTGFPKGSFFSIGDPAGVVFVGETPPSFGGGKVSQTGWLAVNYPLFDDLTRKYNYSYFFSNWSHPEEWVVGGDATLTGGKIGGKFLVDLPEKTALLVEGSLVVQDDDSLANVGAMVLVGGSLDFAKDFSPPDSAAIVFISQGPVTFRPTVNHVRAAILTDDKMGAGAVDPKPEGGLWLEGMYLANSERGSFVLLRERKNNNAPAVMFDYQPEILIDLIDSYGKARVTSWKEVIGGKK